MFMERLDVGDWRDMNQTDMNILDSEKGKTKTEKQNTLEDMKNSKNSILELFQDEPEILIANLNDILDLMIRASWKIEILNEVSENKQDVIRIKFVPPNEKSLKFIDFKNKKVILEFDGEEV